MTLRYFGSLYLWRRICIYFCDQGGLVQYSILESDDVGPVPQRR